MLEEIERLREQGQAFTGAIAQRPPSASPQATAASRPRALDAKNAAGTPRSSRPTRRLRARKNARPTTPAKARARRLAEIEAELGMLQSTFAQNPASDEECAGVLERYAQEPDSVIEDLPRLREELTRLSVNVNLNAESDREELVERERALREQINDLTHARETLLSSIKEIEAQTQEQFNETFVAVAEAFKEMFARLFPGGEAKHVADRARQSFGDRDRNCGRAAGQEDDGALGAFGR